MPLLALAKPSLPLEPTVEPPKDDQLNLALAEALATALETIAFVSPTLLPKHNLLRLPTDSRLVRVHFAGHDTKGWLALAASEQFASSVAENVGMEGDAAGDDALKELANVTCGLLLRLRPGAGKGFRLDPPEVSTTDQTRPAAILGCDDVVTLESDGQLIAATIVTDLAFFGENEEQAWQQTSKLAS